MIPVALLLVSGLALSSLPGAQEEDRLGLLLEVYSWTAGMMGLEDALGVKNLKNAANVYRTLSEGYELLTDGDRRREPDYSPAGMPRVPSHCAESEACGVCYEQAQGELKRVRRTLEELRAIGVETKEMKDDAIAVGTSLSSIQGAGLGWYGARRDIMAGWQRFVRAYEDKYSQLLGSLEAALRQIEQCEKDHFDEPDWYERFGFIYFQFMEASYHPGAILN